MLGRRKGPEEVRKRYEWMIGKVHNKKYNVIYMYEKCQRTNKKMVET